MVTTEERMQILKMVAEHKITAEEGARLLAALQSSQRQDARESTAGPSTPRWFRIRVTDLETGRAKVNVNLPMSLVNVGIKMGARFTPEVEGVDFRDIVEQIKSGKQGKIADMENTSDGERIEIYVE